MTSYEQGDETSFAVAALSTLAADITHRLNAAVAEFVLTTTTSRSQGWNDTLRASADAWRELAKELSAADLRWAAWLAEHVNRIARVASAAGGSINAPSDLCATFVLFLDDDAEDPAFHAWYPDDRELCRFLGPPYSYEHVISGAHDLGIPGLRHLTLSRSQLVPGSPVERALLEKRPTYEPDQKAPRTRREFDYLAGTMTAFVLPLDGRGNVVLPPAGGEASIVAADESRSAIIGALAITSPVIDLFDISGSATGLDLRDAGEQIEAILKRSVFPIHLALRSMREVHRMLKGLSANFRRGFERTMAHHLRNALQPATTAYELLETMAPSAGSRRDRAEVTARELRSTVDALKRHCEFVLAGQTLRGATTRDLKLVGHHLIDQFEMSAVINLEIPDDVPDVDVHPYLPELVLQELVHNAKDAANRALSRAPRIHIQVLFDASRERVDVAVTDDGPGLKNPAEVFALGYTTSGEAARGYGLYLMRQLAREVGGDLRCSHPSPGRCTFVLSLPVTRTLNKATVRHSPPEVTQ